VVIETAWFFRSRAPRIGFFVCLVDWLADLLVGWSETSLIATLGPHDAIEAFSAQYSV
jgi:hypothetical protein